MGLSPSDRRRLAGTRGRGVGGAVRRTKACRLENRRSQGELSALSAVARGEIAQAARPLLRAPGIAGVSPARSHAGETPAIPGGLPPDPLGTPCAKRRRR